ncbi:hypothetical protein [Exiguobacterium sp. s78]|uniref:hypothetical protein n=1 Tax=Exiguobacterium sp. s78 TaxID=2751197 RepID=UPI001BE54897|nr:hypothetical protein [Exiguobacterium sp. s78]
MIPVYEERIMSDLFSSTNNPSYGLPTLPESETDWLTVEIQARIVKDAEHRFGTLNREEERV